MHSGRLPGGLCVPCLASELICLRTSIINSSFVGVDNPPSAWCSAGSSTSSKLGLSLEHIGLCEVEVEVLGGGQCSSENTRPDCDWGVCSYSGSLTIQGIGAVVLSSGQVGCGDRRWTYGGISTISICRCGDGADMLESGSAEDFGGGAVESGGHRRVGQGAGSEGCAAHHIAIGNYSLS